MFVQSVEFIRAHAKGNGNGGKAKGYRVVGQHCLAIDTIAEVNDLARLLRAGNR